MDWLKPSIDSTKHKRIVVIFSEQYEDSESESEDVMEIFYFKPIENIFKSINSSKSIKFKEIKYWIPLPDKN